MGACDLIKNSEARGLLDRVSCRLHPAYDEDQRVILRHAGGISGRQG